MQSQVARERANPTTSSFRMFILNFYKSNPSDSNQYFGIIFQKLLEISYFLRLDQVQIIFNFGWLVRFAIIINQMNESLLQENNREKIYDPYANPPDLQLANTHRQATMVGAVDVKVKPHFCPCCDHIVNKTPLPLCFKDEDLLGLGVGYPLYYKITKYFLMILLGIFFISGSAIYFLMTLQCQNPTSCITFFGIPIINISIMEQNNLNKTQMVNTITAVVIFGIVLYLKTVINEDIRGLVAKKNCPSLYTIMLQNVPSVTNQQLSAWLKERFQQAPVAMNWAFAVEQLAEAHKQKQNLQINRNKVKISFKKFKDISQNQNNQILSQIKRDEKTQQDFNKELTKLQREIQKCDGIIKGYQSEDKEMEKIGTVFVTFEKAETVNDILQAYESTILESFMKTIFTWVKKSRLLLQDRVIIIYKAPAPREVIWENLRFSYIRSFFFQILFIMIMCLMLGGALRTILFFTNYSLSYRIEGETEGKFTLILIGAMISLIVVVINCLTRLVIQFFTYAKKYYSYTKYEGSFCLYYSIFYIVNSCCVVYIVHGQNSSDTKQLLLTDIHLIMLANAFSQPLFKLFDPVMWWRVFRRWYLSRLKPQENPYTQEYMNKLWEGHEISNADNYQYITRVLFITTWFSTVAPVGVLFSLIALLLDYWISKVLLVRYYRIPENISQDIAKPTLMSLQLLPLIYILGILQFNYKISNQQTLFDFLYASLHYGVTTVVLVLIIAGYLIFCKKSVKPATSKTYSQAKLGFTYNYDTTNPVTKYKGNLNYLYEVLKQNEDKIENERIAEMINQSQKSPGKMSAYKEDLYLLRMEMQKKLTSIEKEIEMEELKASQV